MKYYLGRDLLCSQVRFWFESLVIDVQDWKSNSIYKICRNILSKLCSTLWRTWKNIWNRKPICFSFAYLEIRILQYLKVVSHNLLLLQKHLENILNHQKLKKLLLTGSLIMDERLWRTTPDLLNARSSEMLRKITEKQWKVFYYNTWYRIVKENFYECFDSNWR